MSKVKIQGNANGTGVVTLTAPNTNTDRTITLPDSTGSILMTDGDGSALTGMPAAGADTSLSNLTSTGKTKSVHASCKWEQEGTNSIYGSYNISSIVDAGVGITTLNFSSSQNGTTYAAVGNGAFNSYASFTSQNTGDIRMTTQVSTHTNIDRIGNYAVIFGD